MAHFKIFIILFILAKVSSAQPQVTISLIADSVLKKAEYLDFSISTLSSRTHNFTFDKFSKDGTYSNRNLFQYSENIDTGLHKVNIIFKTDKAQNITDTLFIDSNISRVEIFVFISTTDSTGDFVKEIKTLRYQDNLNYLQFSFIDKPKIGSSAAFNILNIGTQDIYGYPNNAFFFGTLYREFRKGLWSQHYPHYIDIKYCDTNSTARPLKKGESIKTWVPNDKDCSEYRFIQEGNYYFELLYYSSNRSNLVLQGLTKINKVDICRQILEFEL